MFGESVKCSDERIHRLSLLLLSLIETCTLIDGVSLLDEVVGKLLLDGAETPTISLTQSEASENVLRFLSHCINEGANLDLLVLGRKS